MKGTIFKFVTLSPNSAPRARGVRYFRPIPMINAYWGAMNTVKEGYKYRKHIIVRHAPEHNGLLQLYTYHFPKTWSAACIANRELIKEAQRRAHALEHDYSPVALEWRLRFFKHYFRVIKGGFDPEPGIGRYARFYQYVFVAIYRDLKAAQQPQTISNEVSFVPVDQRPFRLNPIRRYARPLSLHPAFGTIFARTPENNYAYEKVHLPRFDVVPEHQRTSHNSHSDGHDPSFATRSESESRLEDAPYLI